MVHVSVFDSVQCYFMQRGMKTQLSAITMKYTCGAFGGNRGVSLFPSEKGVFPLDYMHLCDQAKREYLNCLKTSGHQSEKCRHFSKLYLECRMEK
ncbi:hypothetical protein RchiOBHm_Chr4g0404221 [Rosa chinensis]|uniref:CHCH domain-containing protein n=1 Tax=Rosa chinensis TaxID=74649 RepID=A0A2P6QTR9_ROSCH|nr:hypothetical protein RchiOBHm_Chr4g0404221 [Rosa chinensis]